MKIIFYLDLLTLVSAFDSSPILGHFPLQLRVVSDKKILDFAGTKVQQCTTLSTADATL